MSRVITFSKTFPLYHPRKGEDTNFIEMIWNYFNHNIEDDSHVDMIVKLNSSKGHLIEEFFNCLTYGVVGIKSHTIRAGNRWREGDKFSPRVWSGKPYKSKQIIIAPDIEIKKIWDIEIAQGLEGIQINGDCNFTNYKSLLNSLATNDGLEMKDFENWFNKTSFKGQIICWNENINY